MRPLLSTVLRAVLYSLAVLASLVSGLVIARKLSPSDYALYQTTMKRMTWYPTTILNAFGFWAYRYAAQGIPGTASTYLLIAIVHAAVGAAIAYVFTASLAAPLPTRLLASAAVAVFTVHVAARTLLDALRPVRYAAAVLTRRILYLALVLALLYTIGLNAATVLTAVLAATTAALAAELAWLKPWITRPAKRLAVEWLRGLHVPLASSAAAALAGVDAIIAYTLAGDMVVAAYFAATLPATIVAETVSTSVTHLQAYILGGGETAAAYAAARLAILLAAPLLAYMAAHPKHVIALVNPAYQWAAPALTILALTQVANLATSALGQAAAGAYRGRAPQVSRELLRLALPGIASNTAYLALVAAALAYTSTNQARAAAWAAAALATVLLRLALLAHVAPPTARKGLARSLLAPATAYTTLALATAHLAPPPPHPPKRFWDTLAVLLPPALQHLAVYTAAILALDPWARTIAKKTPQTLRKLAATLTQKTKPQHHTLL